MKPEDLLNLGLAGLIGVALATLGSSACGANPICGQPQPAAVETALSPDSSVTIVPAMLAGHPNKDVADVLGVMLEQEGMPNVWTSAAEFVPAADHELEQVASAFGEFVRGQKFETECVLFAQILGERATGVAEVRAVLVDAAGKTIWTERQTPADKEFRLVNPDCPMDCCVLLRDRLRSQFHLTAATRGRVKDGRLERQCSEKSAQPPKAEYAAMEQRVKALGTSLADAKLLVFPVQTGTGPSADFAADLVKTLNEKTPAKASAADGPLQIEITGSSNEQRRLWDLARGLQAHVRETKPDADYTLVAEYLIRPDNQQVWTVHFVICDRAGEWVVVDFQNNHHADFQAVNPKTTEDCGRLVARRLAGYLQ